jgi:hypothetical protein
MLNNKKPRLEKSGFLLMYSVKLQGKASIDIADIAVVTYAGLTQID